MTYKAFSTSPMTGWSFPNGHELHYSSILRSLKFLWPSECSYYLDSPYVTSHPQHLPSLPAKKCEPPGRETTGRTTYRFEEEKAGWAKEVAGAPSSPPDPPCLRGTAAQPHRSGYWLNQWDSILCEAKDPSRKRICLYRRREVQLALHGTAVPC